MRVDVTEDVLGELDGERTVGERRERDDSRESTFELADVGRDAAGDEREHLGVVDGDALRLDTLAENRDPRLEVGRLDVGEQAPLESRTQTLLERRDLARGAIGREHDLRAALVEGVERVEELLLDPFLALDELDVVDEQHVVVAVAPLEALDARSCDRERRR